MSELEELNIRIAKALGWEKVLISDGTPSGESDEYWCSGERYKREIHQRIEYWDPTQEISCAFQVVERMRGMGWAFEIDNHFNEWTATFITEKTPIIGRDESASTVPLAITRAALKALEAAKCTQ
jgi:hypothetical protein